MSRFANDVLDGSSPSGTVTSSGCVWFNPGVTKHGRSSFGIDGAARTLCTIALVAPVAMVGCSTTKPEASPNESAPPQFVDDTDGSGIDHRYDGEFEYFVGGGVASFDCDDDGRPELFLAGGTEPAALFRNRSPRGGPLRFERAESAVTDLTSVTGAYPLDIDSDGIADLVVLRHDGNVVLRGLGDCRFEAANEQFGLSRGDAWTTAFSATWEGENALPTMAFGNYLVEDTLDCDTSRLVRPTTTGDRYSSPVVLAPGYCTLSMLFSDWRRNGERDLRVTNDRHYYRDGSEQLWRISPGAAPATYTAADGWRPLQVWGMGIASHDVSGDGVPEVFIASQGDNKLQTLDTGASGPTYRDIALRRGVTAQRPYAGDDVLPSTAWHPEFADVNNDGLIDLFVTKGNVEAQTDHAMRDPSNLLIGTADGTFVEGAEEAGITRFDSARGAAVVDLDLDGLLDIVVVNRRANITLWRNAGSADPEGASSMGHWLQVRLDQGAPNVDAIGAWLEVRIGERVIAREITVGGGHAGGQLGWWHTGLGTAADIEVRVQWPDGEVGPWMEVGVDRFVTITRGATEPVEWEPQPLP